MTSTTSVLRSAPDAPTAPDVQPAPGSVPSRVVAVVVAHDGERWLPRALGALAGQTRRPDLVVAVDTGSTDDSGSLLRAALGADRVVSAPRRTGFGAAVALGLRHAAELVTSGPDAGTDDWVWLLHDDCAPDARALEHLLEAGTTSERVGVVGPKLVAWDDPTRLLEVGLTVSRTGRREDTLDGAVRDQGQHDTRSDVLAVGSAGLLVRRDLWDRLGGLDPALPLLRDDVDLCWRAHLAGRRVVVAPRAVVADAQAATRRLRPADAVRGRVRRADRRHGLQVALARCAPWAVPAVLAQVLVQAVLRAVGLLAAKAPGAALDELLAAGAVLLAPWRWLGSRRRSRRTRAVPRSSVSPLLAPRSAVLRRAADTVLGARTPGRPPVAAPGDPRTAGTTSPERGLRRLLRAPLTWVLLLVAGTTAVAERGLLGAGVLTGGALRPVVGSATVLWQDAVGTLHGPGLGSAGVASPADAVRAAIVRGLELPFGDRAAARAVDLLLLGAPVLAAGSAYLAAATATRSRVVRAWAAAVWGVSPLLTTALGEGRLGPVAAQLLLPLVAAALARALAGSGSLAAACAAALGLALAGAVLPVLLVLGLVVALGGVLLGRGSARLRAATVLVLAPALLGPWLLELLRRPALLLAGPGAVDAGPPVGPARAVLESAVASPTGWPQWTLLLPFAPLLAAALLGLLRSGRRGWAVSSAWAVALAAGAAALVLPHVVLAAPLAQGAVPGLRAWAGGLLAVALLGVLAAAVTGADGLRARLTGRGGRWRRVLVVPVLAAAVLAPVTAAAGWVWRGTDQPVHRAGSAVASLPAVAADAAAGSLGTRTLVLDSSGDAQSYRLQGEEPGAWTLSLPGRGPDGGARAGSPAAGPSGVVARTVADLLAPQAPTATGPTGPVAALRRLAVGFVLVREPVPATTAERLDSLGGLVRIGAPGGSRLWRVGTAQDPAAARVQLLDPQGHPVAAVPVSGTHGRVDTTVAAGPDGRRLVLSEAASPRWRATLDGRPLRPVALTDAGPWRQAFALPSSAGHLVIGHVDPVLRAWQWAQLGLCALVALLALPVRRPQEPS